MSSLLQDYLTLQAQQRPDEVAVVMDTERLTYGEVKAASNRLARLLIEAGCRRGDRICLFLPKCPAAVVSMLGVLKADCIYVPMISHALRRVYSRLFTPLSPGWFS